MTTPHPQSLSPLRGEGSQWRRGRESWALWLRFFAVFSGILRPKRRQPVACGAHPRSHPFLEGHGTQVWKPASRSLAGQPQAGKPARRRLAGLIPKLRVPSHAGATREGARGRGGRGVNRRTRGRVRSPRPTPAATRGRNATAKLTAAAIGDLIVLFVVMLASMRNQSQ